MGEGKKGRWKRLTNVQFHLNQYIETDSRSALGYFLNTKAKECERHTEKKTGESLCSLAKKL